MNNKYIIPAAIALILIIGIVYYAARQGSSQLPAGSNIAANQSNQASTPANLPANSQPTANEPAQAAVLTPPLARSGERVTKKPFGIYVTPRNSPVQPEKFTGYHTGVDFETFAEEQNSDVAVKAVCGGKILASRYASGYGGVIVQSCQLNGQDVTVVYGHIRLSSAAHKVGDSIKAGDQLAVLGTGYGSETDGERKHLHLGIHKGTSVNITGYVQNKASLDGWLNAQDYL